MVAMKLPLAKSSIFHFNEVVIQFHVVCCVLVFVVHLLCGQPAFGE